METFSTSTSILLYKTKEIVFNVCCWFLGEVSCVSSFTPGWGSNWGILKILNYNHETIPSRFVFRTDTRALPSQIFSEYSIFLEDAISLNDLRISGLRAHHCETNGLGISFFLQVRHIHINPVTTCVYGILCSLIESLIQAVYTFRILFPHDGDINQEYTVMNQVYSVPSYYPWRRLAQRGNWKQPGWLHIAYCEKFFFTIDNRPLMHGSSSHGVS